MVLLAADTPGLGLQNTIILIWWVMIVVIILVGIYLVLKRNSGKRDKKYSCPNCGKVINEGKNFCPYCGTKVEE